MKYGLIRLRPALGDHKSFYMNISMVYTPDTSGTIARIWKKLFFFPQSWIKSLEFILLKYVPQILIFYFVVNKYNTFMFYLSMYYKLSHCTSTH